MDRPIIFELVNLFGMCNLLARQVVCPPVDRHFEVPLAVECSYIKLLISWFQKLKTTIS